ncbi:MAG: DUF4870 domain-containing protein [Candidatus Omnitrophica bacterium]|nr:DUF4870 domain-containing protein [Candidatus Omnitrophota bacterium]
METKDLGKTSTGMQANVAALLSYVLGWLTGLIFFLLEKDNKFVKFHAMQSMIVFGALFVLQIGAGMLIGMFAMMRLGFMIPVLSFITGLLYIISFILWVILMIKAYQGEMFKLPIAGDIAEKQVK